MSDQHNQAGQQANKGAATDGTPKQGTTVGPEKLYAAATPDAASKPPVKPVLIKRAELNPGVQTGQTTQQAIDTAVAAVPVAPGLTQAELSAGNMAPDTLTALNVLLKILAAKEAREAKQEADNQARDAARNTQREKNAKNVGDKEKLRQARCDHMKGGKKKLANRQDPALYQHTYINGDTCIKCLVCRMNWKPGDTETALMCNGRKIRNWTHWGWKDAARWLAGSTNAPSSSEIPQRTNDTGVGLEEEEIFDE